ncbi:hypothetical protein Bca4012_005567 [Brassica carinata]
MPDNRYIKIDRKGLAGKQVIRTLTSRRTTKGLIPSTRLQTKQPLQNSQFRSRNNRSRTVSGGQGRTSRVAIGTNHSIHHLLLHVNNWLDVDPLGPIWLELDKEETEILNMSSPFDIRRITVEEPRKENHWTIEQRELVPMIGSRGTVGAIAPESAKRVRGCGHQWIRPLLLFYALSCNHYKNW